MGMNYELYTNYCLHCGRGDKIHLGKSSWGWTLQLVELKQKNPKNHRHGLEYPQDSVIDECGYNFLDCDFS